MRMRPEKPYVPAGVKRNPNSLTYLFRLIRTQFAKKSQQKFADILESIGTSFPQKRVNKTTIRRIESNEGDIHYFHMEKMAMLTGIPAGALLLFSRMYSNKRDGSSKESNKELGQRLITVLGGVDDNTIFDIDELRRWSSLLSGSDKSLPSGFKEDIGLARK